MSRLYHGAYAAGIWSRSFNVLLVNCLATASSNLRELEARCKEAGDLQLQVAGLQKQLAELEDKANQARTSIDDEGMEPSETSTSAQLKYLIDSLEQRKYSIETQIENQQCWIDTAKATLSKLTG